MLLQQLCFFTFDISAFKYNHFATKLKACSVVKTNKSGKMQGFKSDTSSGQTNRWQESSLDILQAKFYTAHVFLKIPLGTGKNFFKIYRHLGTPTQKGLPALIYAILEIFTV